MWTKNVPATSVNNVTVATKPSATAADLTVHPEAIQDGKE